MVRPVSPGERAAFVRKVQVAVTLLVGASAGLVALQADATLVQAALATAVCLPVGAAIAWFVVPSDTAPADRRSRGEEHPRADGSGDETDERRSRRRRRK